MNQPVVSSRVLLSAVLLIALAMCIRGRLESRSQANGVRAMFEEQRKAEGETLQRLLAPRDKEEF